ncbi:MAG TPA: invasion associated locus B family protein [Rhizomicrobium sp.]
MKRLLSRFSAAAAVSLFCVAAVPASADTPLQLGAYSSWTAFVVGTGDSKSCYAIARPQSSEPAKAKRDPIAFLVTDWPARKAKAEPEVVPGYQFKDGSAASAQVGADKFDFFTKNDGGQGGAWVKATADEARLVAAMRSNGQMVVTGVSKRGTMTHDTYSLAGFSDAVDKIHAACGM